MHQGHVNSTSVDKLWFTPTRSAKGDCISLILSITSRLPEIGLNIYGSPAFPTKLRICQQGCGPEFVARGKRAQTLATCSPLYRLFSDNVLVRVRVAAGRVSVSVSVSVSSGKPKRKPGPRTGPLQNANVTCPSNLLVVSVSKGSVGVGSSL